MSNMTALFGEAALFTSVYEQYDCLIGEAALITPSYECIFPGAPSGFDRLISGFRLI